MATDIRCYACRGFFPISERGCHECGAPRRTKNGHLETARLDRQLYGQAESAVNEQRLGALVARGGQAPVTKAHRDAAKSLMDHL